MMDKKSFRNLMLGIAAMSIAVVAEASPPMVFQHLNSDSGLSQSSVKATYQDSSGLVWLATESGLNRYDGYEVKVYSRERGNPAGLASDNIWAIDEDTDGNLWLATDGGGVAVWNRATDQFSSYRHDPQNSESLSSDSVRNLVVDRAGIVWVATRNAGLNKLDPKTGVVTRFAHDAADENSISGNSLFALLEDRDGNIWVSSDSNLNRHLPASGGFRRYDLSAEIGDVYILALTQDSAGDIWAGTFEAGLARLNPATDRVWVYANNPNDPDSLSNDVVHAILEDSEYRLWVGTESGLNLLDRRSGKFSTFLADSTNPNGLSDDTIMSLYQDSAGLLWVGTRTSGSSRWNPRSWSFGHVYPDWFVNAFADDAQGNIWVGTVGDGLNRIDRTTGERRQLDSFVTDSNALQDERVMSLLVDSSASLWIGTFNGGLSRLSSGGDLETYRYVESDLGTIGADGVMSLYEDRSGRVWIGTFGGGVSLYDPELGEFRRYPSDQDTTSPLYGARATSLAEDENGYIWVGTDSAGLILLDPNRGVVRQYLHNGNDIDTLSSNVIYSLHIDAEKTLWVGTAGGGLNRLIGSSVQPDGVRFEQFGRELGINDVVYGVHSDEFSRLWLSTNRGLSRFDPATKTVRTFHKSHGLQDEEYNFGAHHQSTDGRLFFGGARGFNEFTPHGLQESNAPPRVVLTQFEVLNKDAATEVPVSQLLSVELAYNDDVVSFGFAAMDYADPNRNQYAHRLLGFDEDFVDSGKLRHVTYTNLDAGQYAFQVKAMSADGVWSDIALEIPVTVAAAPWHTTWAYAFYLLSCIALIYGLFRHQNQKLRRKEAAATELSNLVDMRTSELNKRNHELKEASEAKSTFLARMSHEIRTPMNGIIGMTELLHSTDLSARQAEFTQMISHSSESLLKIINDILDLSKIEAGQFKLDHEEFELSEIVDDVVSLLGTQASNKDLELIGDVDVELSQTLIGDPVRLRQVLVNLVGNAVKFTDAGEVVVRAFTRSASDDRATIRIEVSDTGIGIAAGKLQHVFEPFSQADESTTQRFGGTGLGLPICRHLVTMMSGEMGIDSKPDIGSTFWCEIPFDVAQSRSSAQRIDLAGQQILVASPVRSLRKAIMAHLSAHNSNVQMVGSSADLVEKISTTDFAPDAIIIDADAIDLARIESSLRAANNCGTTHVFLSNDAAALDKYELHCCEHAVILRKPLRWPELLRSLNKKVPASPAVEANGSSMPQDQNRHLRVLVIEDNKVNQLVAEGLLHELGCEVVLAPDGRAGIARAATEHYDLILMDAQMPGMDGYEAARLIRDSDQNKRRVPIIGVSANSSKEIGDACVTAGMDDFLSKPYVLEDLASVIERWALRSDSAIADSASDGPVDEWRLDAVALDNIRKLQSEGSPDIITRVLKTYLDGTDRLVNELSSGRVKRCLATMQSAAHALKSSSGSVGALEFSDIARQLEAACRTADAHTAFDLSKRIEAMHSRVVVAVESEINRVQT